MYLRKNCKSRFYQLIYFVNGKRTKVSTKTDNEKEANKFPANFIIPSELPSDCKPKSITLPHFRKEYDEYIEPIKSKGYVRCVNLSFKMLIEFSKDINLERLDIRTIDKFITHTFAITQRGSAIYYRTLKAAFSKAVAWN